MTRDNHSFNSIQPEHSDRTDKSHIQAIKKNYEQELKNVSKN